MPKTVLKIKNMVCPRCIKTVKIELEKLGYETSVEGLGTATIKHSNSEPDFNKIKQVLEKEGFELLRDNNSVLIDELKTVIINLIYNEDLAELNVNLSTFLSKKLNHDYSYLSHLFSSVEGVTIEKYFIHQKIERTKELLVYNELTLSQIAYELGYSNVQYLSTQFKSITGMSPSEFKSNLSRPRSSIDHISQQ